MSRAERRVEGDRGSIGGRPALGWSLLVPLSWLVVLALAASMFNANARQAEAPWINHDVAFHSWQGMEMVGGARLYVDFRDTNPPGSHFLHAALVALTDGLGAPDFLVHHLFVLGLGACGLLLIWSVGRGDPDRWMALLVGTAYLVVVVRSNASNNLFVGANHLPYDFGQREHLFSLLFIPFLIWRLRGGRRSLPWGPWLLLLGFVSVFKPYWIIFLVMTEVLLAWDRRRLDVVTWCFLGAGMASPYILLLVHSVESFMAFFQVVLPYHLGGGYGHYSASYGRFVGSALHRQLLFLGLFLAVGWGYSFYRRTVSRKCLWLLLLLVVGAYLSIVHQHKFWSYHCGVLFALSLVSGTYLIAESLRLQSVRTGRLVGALLLLLTGIGLATSLIGLGTMLMSLPPLGHEVAPLVEGRQRVMFFSMSVDYSYGALRHRVPTVGPWSQHLEIPTLLAIEDVSERQRSLAAHASDISARIEDARPELLVFAPFHQALPPGESLHGAIEDMGVVPRVDYRRWSPERIKAVHHRLRGWIVYERISVSSGKEPPGSDPPVGNPIR